MGADYEYKESYYSSNNYDVRSRTAYMEQSRGNMVKVMMPEIKKALPTVLTPERFTRIALSALNNTPALQKCTPMSFLAALMNAAQLGLEPNTPLGQAYLIPYKNKGVS